MSAIRVVVADDDEDVRGAVAAVVDEADGMKVVGVAPDAAGVVRLAQEKKPDVALIDVNMPGGGVTAARGIKRASPETKVIVLSGHGDRDTVMRLLEAGADGYLVKTSSIEAIIEAVRGAHVGQGSLSGEVTRGVIKELAEKLGAQRREDDVLRRKGQRIQRVLENGILGMVFQPIMALESREAKGVEALARFYAKPKRTPDKWFAEAESSGKLTALECKAVSLALDALADLPARLYVSVNVSPATLMSAAFRRAVDGHDGTRVVVEVTEHAPIGDYTKMARTLSWLRREGIRLAVDDVGAGFASLQHILRLEPDYIKLDIALVHGISEDRSLQALAQAMIAFSDGIGATIIAEGIENEAELAILLELGVGCGQGYHFARPSPLPLAL